MHDHAPGIRGTANRRLLAISLGITAVVMIVQIGLISPPVGMNLFVLNALLPNVGLGQIFRGCWPFVAVMVVMLGVLIAFPQLSLWLPSLMK
jgi:TRAP-type C4-dicarboxylate transport system permease large subunit